MGLQHYKDRVLYNGYTSKERILNDMKDVYEYYRDLSPETLEVEIDNVTHRYIIQDRRFADEELTHKFMLTPYDETYPEGTYVKLLNKDWFIDYIEEENIERDNAYRLLDCNELLKWQDQEGRIYEFPCNALDKTSVYSDGLSRSEILTTSIYQLQVTIPRNEHTDKIDTHDRFIFANSKFHIYNVTRIDKITKKGLLVIIMKRDEMTKEYDDLANNLSRPIGINASLEYNKIKPDNDYDMEYDIAEIIGSNEMSIWDDEQPYKVPNAEIVQWEVDEEFVISRVEDNILYLTPKGNFGKVTIKAKADGVELEKTIRIVFAR